MLPVKHSCPLISIWYRSKLSSTVESKYSSPWVPWYKDWIKIYPCRIYNMTVGRPQVITKPSTTTCPAEKAHIPQVLTVRLFAFHEAPLVWIASESICGYGSSSFWLIFRRRRVVSTKQDLPLNVLTKVIQRCDAQRPICGPCSRFRGHELDDCEFYEGHPPTIQVLEKKEEDLIIKLEYLRRQGGSCEMPRGGTSCGISLCLMFAGNCKLIFTIIQGHLSSVKSLRLELSCLSRKYTHKSVQTLPAGKIQGLWVWTLSFLTTRWFNVAGVRLTHFCAFASEIGFFLDPERFIHSALQNCNLGHHSRPCPSLLYAVCLWGSRAFPYHVQKSFEETVLPYALHFANEDLSGTHPRRCLHVMQAEVLLSMFFLNNGQMVEGSYHANAAASLAISTKSNIIRSPSRAQRSPGDLVDEGEWIDGFWIIVALSNYWVLVNENQTFTFYDAPQMAIDTPWPLSNYRQEKVR